jgi:uncharacterized protein YdhG (YjbR/CyaY superfamily)
MDARMKSTATNGSAAVDEYFANVPAGARKHLSALRRAIRQVVPEAEEVISYKIPAFKFHGMLVYYAAFRNHIGFYPTSSGIGEFKKDLAEYKTSAGAVQFPMDRPLPLDIIVRIVKFRAAENLERKHRRQSPRRPSAP